MTTELQFPSTRCLFGTASRDVTPPAGIYSRMWGAAAHDAAEGVHRPCTATAALFAPIAGDSASQSAASLFALVAVDYGSFQHVPDERALRAEVMQRTGIGEDRLLINLSHTHSSANANSQLTDLPGAALIRPYLAHLTAQIGDAILEARSHMAPAWIAYGYGRCMLARNRDYWDAAQKRYGCGFNPDQPTDDTLLVARVSGDDGAVRATLFNYACHPTTLAWQNRLLSPDFAAAAREVLEKAFSAPALFLQGALGDVAPRDNYVGDSAVADRNGRQLGYAAAAAIEGLAPAGSKFVYTGIVASGTDLGTWAWQPASAAELRPAGQLAAHMSKVALARKTLPPVSELRARLAATSDHRKQELIRRRLFIQLSLGESDTHVMPLWTWRLGQAALVAVPNEPYTQFQVSLRQRFSSVPLFVLGVTNGTLGYLPPRESYGKGIYQEQQSPYAPGCLEQTIAEAGDAIEALFP
jgi:hypothetical protein